VHEQELFMRERLAVALIDHLAKSGTAHIGKNTSGGNVLTQSWQISIAPNGTDVGIHTGSVIQGAVIPSDSKPIGIHDARGHFDRLVTLHDQGMLRLADDPRESYRLAKICNEAAHTLAFSTQRSAISKNKESNSYSIFYLLWLTAES
jgi:hypothetical protein